MGQNVDLGELIKTYGSQLIDVLLGRTTQLLSGVVSGIMLVVIVPFLSWLLLTIQNLVVIVVVTIIVLQFGWLYSGSNTLTFTSFLFNVDRSITRL